VIQIMYIKVKKNTLLILRALALISLNGLIGCSSSLNNQFDCPLTLGVVCKSLDQVNAAVNRGELEGISSNKFKNNKVVANNFFMPYSMIMKTGEPLRYRERVIKVWIAPYEDDVGNYHQGTIVNAVAKKGHWIANFPKVVLED
jgi:conjugal transfer pilus assembly protein TraV